MSNELKLQHREIGGGGWIDCTVSEYLYADKSPEWDARALPRKITLTKTLPSEEGFYYFSDGDGDPVSIINVELIGGVISKNLIACDHTASGWGGQQLDRVELLGGYWAKVEQDHFEFE